MFGPTEVSSHQGPSVRVKEKLVIAGEVAFELDSPHEQRSFLVPEKRFVRIEIPQIFIFELDEAVACLESRRSQV